MHAFQPKTLTSCGATPRQAPAEKAEQPPAQAASLTQDLNLSRAAIHGLFVKRRLAGHGGLPPELREDYKIREFIKTLSPKERKDWNSDEIVHITRGFIFGLKACGTEDTDLDRMTRYALRACFRDGFINNFIAPLSAMKEGLAGSSWRTKLASPLIATWVIFTAAVNAFTYLFNRDFSSFGMSARSLGYYGSPCGNSMRINAKKPIDLAENAAHEVCHTMQSIREVDPEYFPHLVHSSLLDSETHRKDSIRWSWDRQLTRHSKLSGYYEFFRQAAAVASIVRSLNMIGGSDIIQTIRELRYAQDSSEIKSIYSKLRTPGKPPC